MAKTGLYLGDTPIGRIITVSQSTGGTDTSDATATASDILVGKTAYGSGGKITGTIQTKSQATYTPGTANQTITSGVYLTGTQTIKGDSNLVASNIKSGTSIFGVTGTYEGNNSGSGVDVSGVTATASDVLSPKVFVDSTGVEQTGTIVTKTTNDLTVSGATVTVPAGYYASQAKKSVATAIQATPTISISSDGLITASTTQSAGYVSSGAKAATKQLSTKSATTYTPSTSNQTISSGYYLTGTQTIKGDSNLVASNIKSGVSIFGVNGTLVEAVKLSNFSTTSAVKYCTINEVEAEPQYILFACDQEPGNNLIFTCGFLQKILVSAEGGSYTYIYRSLFMTMGQSSGYSDTTFDFSYSYNQDAKTLTLTRINSDDYRFRGNYYFLYAFELI